jgi:hypothetical protein
MRWRVAKFLPQTPCMTFSDRRAIGLVLVYVAAISLLYGFQPRLIYYPIRNIRHRPTPNYYILRCRAPWASGYFLMVHSRLGVFAINHKRNIPLP